MSEREPAYERGPYAKGRQRREAILKTTLEVFSQVGYRGTSLRAIARQLDISPALLQHYFSTREDLLSEIVAAWDEENLRLAGDKDFLDRWLNYLLHNAQIPGLIHLYTAFAIEAADPDHSARPFFARRYEGVTRKIIDDIEDQKLLGHTDPDIDSERVARLLIAACEGLQMRWLHSPDFDMHDEFVFLLEQLGVAPPSIRKGARATVLDATRDQDEQ